MTVYDSVNASGDDASWLLDQQQSSAQDESQEEEKTADNTDSIEAAVAKEMKKEVQKLRVVSISDEAEEWRAASQESTAQNTSIRQAPPDSVLATPMKQMDGALPSPQTEEIHRGKIPMSLESISTSP